MNAQSPHITDRDLVDLLSAARAHKPNRGRPLSLCHTVERIVHREVTAAGFPEYVSDRLKRAAREAYAAGHRDGTTCNMEAANRGGYDDERGVKAFLRSLKAEL